MFIGKHAFRCDVEQTSVVWQGAEALFAFKLLVLELGSHTTVAHYGALVQRGLGAASAGTAFCVHAATACSEFSVMTGHVFLLQSG